MSKISHKARLKKIVADATVVTASTVMDYLNERLKKQLADLNAAVGVDRVVVLRAAQFIMEIEEAKFELYLRFPSAVTVE